MRRAAKTDSNHQEIVGFLRRLGATVLDLSRLGAGCPDLCVGFQGRNYLMEVKDGRKVPSKRKLTPDEMAFHALWRGQVAVVESVSDALKTIGVGPDDARAHH